MKQEPQVFCSGKLQADPKFSQHVYSEEEVIEFTRRMMFEIVLGNNYFLFDEGTIRAKLPPRNP